MTYVVSTSVYKCRVFWGFFCSALAKCVRVLRVGALYRLQEAIIIPPTFHLFYWTACYYRLSWLFSPCPQGVAISCYMILMACVGQFSC